MTAAEQRKAAEAFLKNWGGGTNVRGNEKQDTQQFWTSLLQRVYGVDDPENKLQFEKTVLVDNMQTGKRATKFIDVYLPETRVLIEQKGAEIDLSKGEKQSDGSLLTPYQQARRYGGYLSAGEQPRWIVVCNFKEFQIHDMNTPNGEPEVLLLKDLAKEVHRLNFLVQERDEHIQKELEVSIAAGEIVGSLYDAFAKQYAEPDAEQTLKSLNKLCVRLVFCLYAEDAGIFGSHAMFHDYLETYPTQGMRKALVDLFKVLDTPEEKRDRYLKDDSPALAAFPYVNGGLFADEDVEVPPFTDEIRELLLVKASENFDWSVISPTIFGAVFESTLNPETRRKGGMHYTSIENIHKVIDPLFLDELKGEFSEITQLSTVTAKQNRLEKFQNKLAGLTFLDPACGSGNFLTETYLSLRRLENKTIAELIVISRGKNGKGQVGGQIVMGGARSIDVKVSIGQFYGIEINDFAVTVAKTALWIAESQMLKETEAIVLMQLDFLPLKTNASIHEANALRVDWETIVLKNKLSYIMGNPPFIGYSLQSKGQKADILSIYVDENGKPYKAAGKIDYVSGWYFKAAQLMHGTSIKTAFVSTNSITQGEQVTGVWKPLCERFGIHIDFAYRTFRWDSEASMKAQVHCVIVGFENNARRDIPRIYMGDHVVEAAHINPYLIDGDDIFIESRSKPLCVVPKMVYGNKPVDGGNLILTEEEKKELVRKRPEVELYIKEFIGAAEFINNRKRYCIWLKGISPAMIRGIPEILKRVEKVQEFRLSSKKEATKKQAEVPTLFAEIRQPTANYIVIPEVSSQSRRYIPITFLKPDIICSNKLQLIPDATIYHFGILTSNVHMAWMRTVCGRLKSDYDYSGNIVYNNFPWPNPTNAQKARIEQTAQAILDARALYQDSSLADLYDEVTMPPELRRAHQENDRAVMDAYGFTKGTEARTSESACVAELMKLYQKLVEKE